MRQSGSLQSLPSVLDDEDEGIAKALYRDAELDADPGQGRRRDGPIVKTFSGRFFMFLSENGHDILFALPPHHMSFLADFYIAREDEAIAYDAAPDRFPDRVQSKGLTPFQLSMLWVIMLGQEWNVACMKQFPCLFGEDTGERLVHRFPPEMVVALSRLPSDTLAAMAAKWAATQEMSWPESEAIKLVDDLARLSRDAETTGRALFIWSCI